MVGCDTLRRRFIRYLAHAYFATKLTVTRISTSIAVQFR